MDWNGPESEINGQYKVESNPWEGQGVGNRLLVYEKDGMGWNEVRRGGSR